MGLNVLVRSETEDWLQEAALREGLSKETIAARLLEQQWVTARRPPDENLSESELLERINVDTGFSSHFWKRFKELKAHLDAETLTEDERQEMIRLNAQIEGSNAERIAYLAQLARRRGVTLPEIMQSLGVGPIQVP
jgi:hypothetical protein